MQVTFPLNNKRNCDSERLNDVLTQPVGDRAGKLALKVMLFHYDFLNWSNSTDQFFLVFLLSFFLPFFLFLFIQSFICITNSNCATSICTVLVLGNEMVKLVQVTAPTETAVTWQT